MDGLRCYGWKHSAVEVTCRVQAGALCQKSRAAAGTGTWLSAALNLGCLALPSARGVKVVHAQLCSLMEPMEGLTD
jgi:hypothetical protein